MSVEQESEQIDVRPVSAKTFEQRFLAGINPALSGRASMVERCGVFDDTIKRLAQQKYSLEVQCGEYEASIEEAYVGSRQELMDEYRGLEPGADITELAHKAAILSPEDMLHDTPEQRAARIDITDVLLSATKGEPIIVLFSREHELRLQAGTVTDSPRLNLDSEQRLALEFAVKTPFNGTNEPVRFNFDELVVTESDGTLKSRQEIVIGQEAISTWLKDRLHAATIDDLTTYTPNMADQDAVMAEICAQVRMTLEECGVRQEGIDELKRRLHDRILTFREESVPPKHVFRAITALDSTPKDEIHEELLSRLVVAYGKKNLFYPPDTHDRNVEDRILNLNRVCGSRV